MAREIRTEVHIDAPPAEVWAVLVDLGAYAGWNPFIVEASGLAVVGRRLRLRMRVGRRHVTVRPTVTECRAGERLRWVGRVGVRGVFDAVHTHELAPDPTGTRYTHRERITGLLVPAMARTLDATETAFHDMNEALGREVRRRSPTST